jgi:hypothetical protein
MRLVFPPRIYETYSSSENFYAGISSYDNEASCSSDGNEADIYSKDHKARTSSRFMRKDYLLGLKKRVFLLRIRVSFIRLRIWRLELYQKSL